MARADFIGPPVPIDPAFGPQVPFGKDYGLGGEPVNPFDINPKAPIGIGAAQPAAAPAGQQAAATLKEIFAPQQPAAGQGAAAPRVSMSGPPAPLAPTGQESSRQAQGAGSGDRQAQGGGRGGGGGWKGIDGWLRTLMDRLVNDAGFGEELLANMRNEATQTSKVRERDRVMRRADDFAARGLFGSGLQKDAVMGIEGEESVALQGALNQIEFQNAQAIQQGLRDSIQVLNAMIAKKLGQGNLNIQREALALDRAKLALQSDMFNWDKWTWKYNNSNPFDGGGTGDPLVDPGQQDDPGGYVGDGGRPRDDWRF